MNGVLHSINTSKGGVPKLPSESCEIRVDGIVGDGHRHRDHGGPDRAVVLFSQDLIDALRAEGHPIAAGTTGENLTLAGVDWKAMVPGATVEVGEVVLELTKFTSPCQKIGGSFCEQHFERISEKVHPGWSRLSARVLKEGTVRVGDAVRVVGA